MSKEDGLVVLHRTRNSEWHLFEEGVSPADVESVMRSCKSVTASAWVWFGPRAIAVWMIDHPSAREDEIPIGTLRLAKKQMESLAVHYEKTSKMLREMADGIVIPKRKKK